MAEKNSGNELSMSSMCKTVGLNRTTFYRWFKVPAERKEELALRDEIHKIAVDFSRYGYRRITSELQMRGFCVNHKHVLRLMRQDNLLCLRKRPAWLASGKEVYYPNLLRNLTITGINQVWVADITYIRLRWQFVYLAAILDRFSRRCVGWQIDDRYDVNLTASALKKAMSKRNFQTGLIHHSDQGSQYTSNEYIDLLKRNGIQISMSRRGNPYDNAFAESFMKTLKYEEILMSEYRDLQDARKQIGHFIEKVYNRKRLHSALGYLPPVEFERQQFSTFQQCDKNFP